MDYGKLAYLKIEDLQRQLSDYELKASGLTSKTIISESYTDQVFSGNFFSAPLLFTQKGAAPVDVAISFSINSAAAAFTAKCELKLNGVQVERKMLAVSANETNYTLNYVLSEIPQGKNEISFSISADDTLSRVVKNFYIKLSGNGVGSIKNYVKINLIEDGTFDKIAYGDGKFVKMFNIINGNLSLAMQQHERQDYALCSFVFYEENDKCYDLLYFFIDEDKLFMTAVPIYSEFEEYTVLIDEGVQNVSAIRIEKGGAAVCYIKGSEIMFAFAKKDDVSGKILAHIQDSLRLKAGMPLRATAVLNLDKGFGFTVTDKLKKNTLMMFDGDILNSKKSTLKANIFAYVA